jgi:hypothetical protein
LQAGPAAARASAVEQEPLTRAEKSNCNFKDISVRIFVLTGAPFAYRTADPIADLFSGDVDLKIDRGLSASVGIARATLRLSSPCSGIASFAPVFC